MAEVKGYQLSMSAPSSHISCLDRCALDNKRCSKAIHFGGQPPDLIFPRGQLINIKEIEAKPEKCCVSGSCGFCIYRPSRLEPKKTVHMHLISADIYAHASISRCSFVFLRFIIFATVCCFLLRLCTCGLSMRRIERARG